jgi:hypothetical protein
MMQFLIPDVLLNVSNARLAHREAAVSILPPEIVKRPKRLMNPL